MTTRSNIYTILVFSVPFLLQVSNPWWTDGQHTDEQCL